MTINNEHKKLNVPNLRFPEFQGEWEELGLSELLDFKNGLNPKPNKFGKGIKFISVMDILNNAVITYDCIKASVDVTEKELSDFSLKKEIYYSNAVQKLWRMLVERMFIWMIKLLYLEVLLFVERKKENMTHNTSIICYEVRLLAKE